MANAERIAGVNSYLLYGAETTYGTPAPVTNHFGIVKDFKPGLKNNLITSRGYKGTTSGGRNVVKTTGGKFEVSFNVDFEPQLWDWLRYVLGGTRNGSGTGANPYIYYEGNTISSLTVSNSIDNETTDREEQYLGCVISSVNIKSTVGEAVQVSIDFVAAKINKNTAIPSTVELNTGDPYTFVGGSIEIPDGSPITNIIDSVEIIITRNAEILHGLGSRVGKTGVVKARDYQVKFTVKYLDDDLMDLFLGSATGPTNPTRSSTMSIKFTNGNNKYIDFVFTGVTFESYDLGATLNEVLSEDITAICESLTVREQQVA